VVRLIPIEARLRGKYGQAGPMLDAVEAFFLYCGAELTIAEKRGGSIAMKGVKAEDSHISERNDFLW
jgi:hypothetical protein